MHAGLCIHHAFPFLARRTLLFLVRLTWFFILHDAPTCPFLIIVINLVTNVCFQVTFQFILLGELCWTTITNRNRKLFCCKTRSHFWNKQSHDHSLFPRYNGWHFWIGKKYNFATLMEWEWLRSLHRLQGRTLGAWGRRCWGTKGRRCSLWGRDLRCVCAWKKAEWIIRELFGQYGNGSDADESAYGENGWWNLVQKGDLGRSEC